MIDDSIGLRSIAFPRWNSPGPRVLGIILAALRKRLGTSILHQRVLEAPSSMNVFCSVRRPFVELNNVYNEHLIAINWKMWTNPLLAPTRFHNYTVRHHRRRLTTSNPNRADCGTNAMVPRTPGTRFED